MNNQEKEKTIRLLAGIIGLLAFSYGLFLLVKAFDEKNQFRFHFLIAFVFLAITAFLVFYLLKKNDAYVRKLDEYSFELEEANRRSDSIELNRKKQEIITLQSQINPHFLYNTLDTFRGIALEHEAYELLEMIGTLSSMLKYSVNYNGEMVSLNAELSYLNNYLKIQKLRFPDRFIFEKSIELEAEELLLTMCPRLIIQPLIENAIRHGFKDMRSGGIISLHIYPLGDDIIIEVGDNGCGMGAEEVRKINRLFDYPQERIERKQKDGGLGINNVNDRIKMYCGKEYGLHFRSTLNVGTQVEIRMPRKFK